jgi:hypothetical protein
MADDRKFFTILLLNQLLIKEIGSVYDADIFAIEYSFNDIELQKNGIYIGHYNSIKFSNIDDHSIFPYWNSILIKRPPDYEDWKYIRYRFSDLFEFTLTMEFV